MANENENVKSAYKEGMTKNSKTREPFLKFRSRIDFLALPKRTAVASTYKNYEHLFDAYRKNVVLKLLLELYALSQQEAEEFMGGFKAAREKSLTYAQCKRKRAKMQKRRLQQTLEDDIFRAFQKLVEKLILYTYQHPYPNLRPVRVNHYSDYILKSIFNIIPFPYYELPNNIRDDVCNDISVILLRLSDWLAVWLDKFNAMAKNEIKPKRKYNDIPDNFDDFMKNVPRTSSKQQLKS